MKPLASLAETVFYVSLFFLLFQLYDVLWDWQKPSVFVLLVIFGLFMFAIKRGPFEPPKS
jgi:hypothetical protein